MTSKSSVQNLIIIASFMLSIGALWTSLSNAKKSGLAYVDIGRLVNEYKLKKDLENASSKDLYRIKRVIDSLEMAKKVLKVPSSHLDSEIAYAKGAFQQYYQITNNDINKKIWERLNVVIKQYGKDEGLKILIGANGEGTVLYGDDKYDATDDLIKYVNAKYEKGN